MTSATCCFHELAGLEVLKVVVRDRGHALGVGQVGVGHERAPQRDGVGDAEDAAQDDDQDRLEVGEYPR